MLSIGEAIIPILSHGAHLAVSRHDKHFSLRIARPRSLCLHTENSTAPAQNENTNCLHIVSHNYKSERPENSKLYPSIKTFYCVCVRILFLASVTVCEDAVFAV